MSKPPFYVPTKGFVFDSRICDRCGQIIKFTGNGKNICEDCNNEWQYKKEAARRKYESGCFDEPQNDLDELRERINKLEEAVSNLLLKT